MHARRTDMSDSTEHNARTIYDMQGTGGHTHTQHTTHPHGATERNPANSGHAQRRAASPERNTPTQTAPWPSSPEDQGKPELDTNLRYGQQQLRVSRAGPPPPPATMKNRLKEQPHRNGQQGKRSEPKIGWNTPTIVTTQPSTVSTQPQHLGRHPAQTVSSTAPKEPSTAPSRYRQNGAPTRRGTHNNNSNK